MGYVDGHVHIWTDDFVIYPLSEGTQAEDLVLPRFLPEDIWTQAAPSGVDRIVLIQMSYYGTDNRYMLDVIERSPQKFRGVAIVDAYSPRLAEEMLHLKNLGVRGFRIRITDEISRTRLHEGAFDRMFDSAREENVVICVLMSPESLPALYKTCQRFPETRVVIDHLARIGMDARVRQEELQSLCSLAQFPEVRVKVSAFYALGEKCVPHLDLAELIRCVYDAYGAHRLFWGSDCPFQILTETYEDSISLIRDRLDFLSVQDKEWILARTAEQLFFG